MRKRIGFLLGVVVLVFILWRAIVSFHPREAGSGRAELHELQRLNARVSQIEALLQQMELSLGDLRSDQEEIRDFVEKSIRTVPVASKDVVVVADLEKQYLSLRRRIDDELKDMKIVRSSLDEVARRVAQGSLYELQVAEFQKRVEARLAASENEARQAQLTVHDRLDEWSGTLNLFAAILAVLMTVVTGAAGLVIYFKIQAPENPTR